MPHMEGIEPAEQGDGGGLPAGRIGPPLPPEMARRRIRELMNDLQRAGEQFDEARPDAAAAIQGVAQDPTAGGLASLAGIQAPAPSAQAAFGGGGQRRNPLLG